MLQAVGRGDKQAAPELLSLVYEDLRRLAAARMSQEPAGQTLQATALVHEAWMRLTGGEARMWDNRGHFFSAAAEAMRRILIERARKKACVKRGGDWRRLDVSDWEVAEATPDEKLLLIDEALAELQKSNPERGQVVVMKFFAGLSNREIGESLGISERSVNRHWMCARAWLFLQLQKAQA